ncbi:MAG: hypothetical protein WKG01_14900 [Kofleriaceae bacterium]
MLAAIGGHARLDRVLAVARADSGPIANHRGSAIWSRSSGAGSRTVATTRWCSIA